MMNKLFLFIIILFSPLGLLGQKFLYSNSSVSFDNEEQLFIETNQGYITQLDSLFRKDSIFIKNKTLVGLSNGLRYYRTDLESNRFTYNQMRITSKVTYKNKLVTQFNPSMLISKNHTLFIWDFNSSIRIKKFYIELNSEKDLVGARALENKLTTNYYGLSMDYSPFKPITIVGGIQYNTISDGSKRWFYISRLIYTLKNEKVFFDLRTRLMRGGQWSEYYFSPNSITQHQIGVGYSTSYLKDKGQLRTYVGSGLQTIDGKTNYLISVDVRLKNQISSKILTETNLGLRNFNEYYFWFGNFKLVYNF